MKQLQRQQSIWPTRLRVVGFIITSLIIVAGVIIWIFVNQNSLSALFGKIITGVGILLTLLQFIPVIFSRKASEPVPAPSPAPQPPPINIYNVLPGAQSPQPPAVSEPHASTLAADPPRPASDPLTLRAQPLPTDPRNIQQRSVVVKEVYDMLIAPDAAAVALCAIGGIGKSTLASLVFKHTEQERRAGRGPFHAAAILLRINQNTTFLELAANIFAAVGKSMPDLSTALPPNQAFAVFNALNTAAPPRLIVLDQFENFLDEPSGKPLPASIGVGEFLDALNSQPCASRVLLTSRPLPRGARDDRPASLSIYHVDGLTAQEGIDYLRSQNVAGSETEMREAVKRCKGHGLALKFLCTLLQTYNMSLGTLLNDRAYTQLWHGQIAENLLDRIFNALPSPSQQLLCAFSLYREAMPIEAALAVIVDTTKAQALKNLENPLLQHLIQPVGGLYQLHPIVATYADQHFVADGTLSGDDAMRAAHERAAQYYLQVASANRPDDGWKRIADVQPLIEAVWQFCQAGKYQEAYQLMDDEELFSNLRLWGANTDLLELCQLLLSGNWQWTQQEKALIYSNVASVSGVLGKKQEALQYYERALAICWGSGRSRRRGSDAEQSGVGV